MASVAINVNICYLTFLDILLSWTENERKILSQSLSMIMSDEQIFTTNIYVSAHIGVIMYKLINDCLPFDLLSGQMGWWSFFLLTVPVLRPLREKSFVLSHDGKKVDIEYFFSGKLNDWLYFLRCLALDIIITSI